MTRLLRACRLERAIFGHLVEQFKIALAKNAQPNLNVCYNHLVNDLTLGVSTHKRENLHNFSLL